MIQIRSIQTHWGQPHGLFCIFSTFIKFTIHCQIVVSILKKSAHGVFGIRTQDHDRTKEWVMGNFNYFPGNNHLHKLCFIAVYQSYVAVNFVQDIGS